MSGPTSLRILLAAVLASHGPLNAQAVAASPSPTLTLENESLLVVIDSGTASIKAVTRKNHGTPQDLPVASSEILRLRIPVGLWDGHRAAGSQAERYLVRARGPDMLTLVTSRFATNEGHFAIGLEIRYRLQGNDLITQLRVDNGSRKTIDEITFPALGIGPAADGSETLSMASGPASLRKVFSDNRIRSHHDPFERLDANDMRGWIFDDPAFSTKSYAYPSGFLLHSAWTHYRAGDFGIGWESRDQTFQTQYAVIERKLLRDRESATANQRTYELSWKWVPTLAPGASWVSPEVVLQFDTGDWHAIARQHREWLATWLPRPVVAEKFRSGLGWMSRGVSDFDQIPAIARQAVSVGTPYILIYGWYGSGMNGLSYDFFPQAMLGGEASLRRNLRAARELGAYPLAWYNGTTTSEITREHREQAHDWVVLNRHGGFVVDGRWSLFDPDRPTHSDDNSILLNYDMATQAGAFNLENVRRMILDYGFSGFEMDQGAKNYPAYSPRGGPNRPELRYTEGARQVYEGARTIVKSQDPNNILLGEGYSDLINQYLDSTWTFEGGFVSVPLHTYARYSLPWITMPAGIFAPDRGYANQAFLMNAPLDIFLDVSTHPEFAAHLRKLQRLKQAVQSSLYDGDFSDGEGFALLAGASSHLLAKSYIQRDKQIAVVVVNTGDQRESATLALVRATNQELVQHRLGQPATRLLAEQPIALELAPFDVNVLVSKQAAQP